LGLLGPADPGIASRQERQIVRSASDLDGFLPERMATWHRKVRCM